MTRMSRRFPSKNDERISSSAARKGNIIPFVTPLELQFNHTDLTWKEQQVHANVLTWLVIRHEEKVHHHQNKEILFNPLIGGIITPSHLIFLVCVIILFILIIKGVIILWFIWMSIIINQTTLHYNRIPFEWHFKWEERKVIPSSLRLSCER